MFVENITRYNFDPITEKKSLEKYKEMLSGWECEQRGARCVTLTSHECTFIDTHDESENKE